MGCQVYAPFGQGNQQCKGYVAGLTDQAGFDRNELKDMVGIIQRSVITEPQLI